MDQWRLMPFSSAGDISQDPEAPTPGLMSGGWLHDLTPEVAGALIQYTLPRGGPPLLVFTEVRHAGGAITRREPDWSAFSNRNDEFLWMSLAIVMDPAMSEAVRGHIGEVRMALSEHLTGRVYMNFLEGDESARRARDGFSDEAFQRLCALKAQYDPDHLLRFGYDLG
jgi:FAD/FMN-containing dehydrogenase